MLRLRIPELNEERRKELVKIAHKYAETARVAVRHVRRDAMDVIKKLEKDHKISKDDHDRFRGDVQKATDVEDHRDRPDAGGQGKGDPHGLRIAKPCPRPSSAKRAAVRSGAASRRHHHGWQWPLGGGARIAAREGHRRGVEALRRTVRAAGEIGIKYHHHLFLQRGKLVAARR